MAGLGLAVGAGAVLEAALLARAVVAPCTSDIGSRVSNIGLAEASDKAGSSVLVILHFLLEHPRGDTLVVTRGVGVVSEHGSAVDGEPRQGTNVFVVRSSLEADKSESGISLGVILGALLLGIVKIGPAGAVNGTVGDLGGSDINVTLFFG